MLRFALQLSVLVAVTDWLAASDVCSAESQDCVLHRQVLSTNPRIYMLDNFLTQKEVDHLLAKSVELAVDVTVPARGAEEPDLYSQNRPIPMQGYTDDPVLMGIERKLSAASNLPYEPFAGATIQLLHRNASGSGAYEVHHDHNAAAMDISKVGWPRNQMPNPTELQATLLGYLTDVEKGGETAFPCVCDRANKLCVKRQAACKFLYENGVFRATLHRHNDPFREMPKENRKKAKKLARFLVNETDRLCKGETDLGIRVKPKARRAALFFSNSPRGPADPRQWHASCAVTVGVKKSMQRFMFLPQDQEATSPHAVAQFSWV